MSSNHAKTLAPMRKQEKRKWIPESAGEDRLSTLPDELLHKIMSFMATKHAVQTCVLSKRWESLWKSLPYLDFSLETFPFKGELLEGDYSEEDPVIRSFNNFITQVLARRHHTDLVEVFVYPFYGNICVRESVFMVERLIAYAVDHNVQELTIVWDHYWKLDKELPKSFYTCQSLEALNVDRISQLSKFLTLPALKSLHLEDIELSQRFFHPRNFSGCPNLETLILDDIFLCEDTTLFINAPNLKRLGLSFGRGFDENYFNRCKVVIDAPRLTTFGYYGYAPTVYSSDKLASIGDAYFDIYNHRISIDEEGEEFPELRIGLEHVLHSINTLKEFGHVKSLTLSLETVEGLATYPSLLKENRLPFANLKYLKIELPPRHPCKKVEIPACVLNFFLNDSTKFKYC